MSARIADSEPESVAGHDLGERLVCQVHSNSVEHVSFVCVACARTGWSSGARATL